MVVVSSGVYSKGILSLTPLLLGLLGVQHPREPVGEPGVDDVDANAGVQHGKLDPKLLSSVLPVQWESSHPPAPSRNTCRTHERWKT